jgi:type I restriction enzyme R subunit
VSASFTESVVEEAALEWLRAIGWQIAHGPDIASDLLAANQPAPSRLQRLRDRPVCAR